MGIANQGFVIETLSTIHWHTKNKVVLQNYKHFDLYNCVHQFTSLDL